MSQEPDLNRLRESCEEDMLFGIGYLNGTMPYIHLFFEDWSKKLCELVRQAILLEGLQIRVRRLPDAHFVMHLATHAMVQVEARANGQTSILRCPAWDATLEPIMPESIAMFEAGRLRLGVYSLLFQTPEWEFLCTREKRSRTMEAGEVLPRTHPLPPNRRGTGDTP